MSEDRNNERQFPYHLKAWDNIRVSSRVANAFSSAEFGRSKRNVLLNTSITGVDFYINTGYTGVMKRHTSSQEVFEREHAARFLFLSGRLCLDFAHTGGGEERQVFEAWHEPTDLAAWFADSSLQMEDLEVLPADLRTAYELREAIWAGALALAHGGVPSPDDLTVINAVARHPDLVPQLVPGASKLCWASPFTVQAALSVVARDAITLFAGEHAQRIRQCANPQCLLLFVDTSRPGQRRWCSMQRCGNMPKTARYRSRHQTQTKGVHQTPPEAH